MLSVNKEVDGACVRLSFQGDLTVAHASELKQHLMNVDEKGPWQLDLSHVEMLDLAGLQVFCAFCRSSETFNQGHILPVESTEAKAAITQAGFHRSCSYETVDKPCIWCRGVSK